MTLHELLDTSYDATRLRAMLDAGADLSSRVGGETPLHVAVRRRRLEAAQVLVRAEAPLDAPNAHGKTAYAHAIRRAFDEIADWLEAEGADTTLAPADRLAVALTHGRLDEARALLDADPLLARTGNPEEDRILADLAGRMNPEPVAFLIAAGADLSAKGLDGGAALHQAAWFGSPENARQLIAAGAPLDDFDNAHESSPLGWAVHGSRYSGDAERRQDAYVAIVQMLMEAGAAVEYPEGEKGACRRRLVEDASPTVMEILKRYGVGA